MINFIIVDDNNKFLEIIREVVIKVMMKNKFEYKTHCYTEYDEKFYDAMNSSIPNKIYIMDIETRNASGIDVARKIRKTDIDSIIIFATVHNEAGLVLLKDDLMFLTFLCKFDDFENNLYNSIKKSLEFIHHRATIKFNDRGTIYTIPLNDILYVTKESNDRKAIIKTCSSEYKVNLTLKEIINLCDNSFTQTHRCCFVNMDKVRVLDKRNNIIEFEDGTTIDLLSPTYKKGIDIV